MVSKAPRSSGILTYLRQSGLPCEVGRALLPKVLKRKHKSIGDPPRRVAELLGFTALSFWALLASGSKYIIQGLCKPMPSLLGGLARWAG